MLSGSPDSALQAGDPGGRCNTWGKVCLCLPRRRLLFRSCVTWGTCLHLPCSNSHKGAALRHRRFRAAPTPAGVGVQVSNHRGPSSSVPGERSLGQLLFHPHFSFKPSAWDPEGPGRPALVSCRVLWTRCLRPPNAPPPTPACFCLPLLPLPRSGASSLPHLTEHLAQVVGDPLSIVSG